MRLKSVWGNIRRHVYIVRTLSRRYWSWGKRIFRLVPFTTRGTSSEIRFGPSCVGELAFNWVELTLFLQPDAILASVFGLIG